MAVSKKILCGRITPIQAFKALKKEATNRTLLELESGTTLYLHPCDQCINPVGKLGFLKRHNLSIISNFITLVSYLINLTQTPDFNRWRL